MPEAIVEFTFERADTDMGDLTVVTEDGGGNGIEGVSVWIQGPVEDQGSTDADGVKTFELVPIGEYDVTAKYGDQQTSVTVAPEDFE